MRLADYFDATAEQYPDHIALEDQGKLYSFSAAQRMVHAVAHALDHEPGLRPGAHVGIYSPNDYRVPILHLGINRCDRVWLSAHTRNPVDVNIEVLSFMDCEFMFFHSAYEQVVPKLKQGLTKVVRFICIDRPSEHGDFLDEWTADHNRPYRSGVEDPLRPAVLQPTGGTTGPSKAAVYTHRSLETMFIGCRECFRYTTESRSLAVAPLTHAGGMIALANLCCGGRVVVINLTRPVQVLEEIERARISHLFLPPTVLYMLLNEPGIQQRDLSSLVMFTTGTAPVAPEKVKEATRIFGPVMTEGYGLTECGIPLVWKNPEDYIHSDGSFDDAALASTGRAVKFSRVEIMDPQGNFLPPGERGEIVIQTGSMMREYYKNPKETEDFLRFGWGHSGDVGIKDVRGFITVVDRIKEMIVTGGFNVFPAQVEAVILEHEAVLECAVVGVPDEKWGEAVKAVVQVKPGKTVDPEVLISLCRERLGGPATPKSVEFWNELPRSAVGKLLRREVRAHYWKDHWRSVS
jgi:acyl-CoA synthetase (AMP-forming)/AMP-acid ligase II